MYGTGLAATLISSVLALPLVLTAANAHHSFAIYTDEITEIEGELVDVHWGNPHILLTVRVDEAGQEADWMLETGNPYVLQRRGLPRELFRQGDRIRAAGRVHRAQAAQLWLHNLMLGDGQELLMIAGVEPRWNDVALGGDGSGVPVADTAAQDRGLFRVWSRPVLRPIAFSEELPYRQEPPSGGAEWLARMDELAARCESVGMPGVMATPYPFEFRNHGAWIRLTGFSNNAVIDRTIHVSGAGLEAAPEPSRFGYSTGRWVTDNRLEVTTTRIDWPYFDDSLGIPQSDLIEAFETFTLSDDQQRLDYEMIVTDPDTFTETVTAVRTYWVAPGESPAEPTHCAE
ncbi:MAG: hypothetical protein F4181_14245 [Proteobacteria bacterium]|nr:hypothetical protein [Pseudomonadota bacterium]